MALILPLRTSVARQTSSEMSQTQPWTPIYSSEVRARHGRLAIVRLGIGNQFTFRNHEDAVDHAAKVHRQASVRLRGLDDSNPFGGAVSWRLPKDEVSGELS